VKDDQHNLDKRFPVSVFSHSSTSSGLSCPFQIFCLPIQAALPGRSVSDEAERSMISKLKSLLEPKNGTVDGGHWCCQKMKGIWIYRDDEDRDDKNLTAQSVLLG